MTNILLVQAKHSPYHLARLEKIYNQCREIDFDVKSIELSHQSDQYKWQTETSSFHYIITLFQDKSIEDLSFVSLCNKLFVVLKEIKPDVVVLSGYGRWIFRAALLWCKFNRISTILLSESKEDDFPRDFLTEKLKSLIIQQFDAALVGGHPHQRYLEKLGFNKNAIYLGYDVIGNDYFNPSKIKQLPRPVEKRYFLAINRFIPKKNISFIVEAYAKYKAIVQEQAIDLILAGDGELFPTIKHQIQDLNLEGFVHLPGFLQIDELLPFFAHASCFIHASTQEQWGLVVNEAMASGLPIFVATSCGCFEDLVQEGINGYGFDPSRCEQLVDLMVKATLGEIDLPKFGQASLEHIQGYSPEFHAAQLIKAIHFTLAK
jgi:1,2-diacylglycerol 3-alpha-glucosyltransferase